MQKSLLKFLSTISCILFVSTDITLAAPEPKIRVLVLQSKDLYFKADSSKPLIVEGIGSSWKSIKSLKVQSKNGQVKYSIDNDSERWFGLSKNRQIRIRTRDPRGVWLGNRRYGGELRLLLRDDSVKVVNVLRVEKYLRSVVGSEMPKDWPMEALKAQAIAARTYVLNQLKRKVDYDVDSSVSNQVYLGVEAETIKTRKAVDSTRSLVMLYKGKLIDAVFHSSSGGKTEESHSVWGKHKPYLISVLDYDQDSPSYEWEKKIKQKVLQ